MCLVTIISVIILKLKDVIFNERGDSQVRKNKETEPDRIHRRPVPFDENYEYDDPDLQRRVNLAPGVFNHHQKSSIIISEGSFQKEKDETYGIFHMFFL